MSMYQLLGNGLIIDLIDEGFMDIENKNEKIWNRYLQQDTKFQSSNQSFIQSNKMQTKGQTKSEWIYKVIEFPNNQFKNWGISALKVLKYYVKLKVSPRILYTLLFYQIEP